MSEYHPIEVSRLRPARQGLAGLLVGLFIFVQLTAVSSPLHTLLHRDATAPTHACAVTLLSHGQIALASGNVLIAAPLCFALPRRSAPRAFVPSADYHLLPGRGPPAA